MYSDERDIDILINVSLEIGDKMGGQKIPDDNQETYFAEGLCQKIMNHIMSANYLFRGYELDNGKIKYESKIDFASIAVLTRAALETYLTLNYVFIAENNADKKSFRFLCWDLAGYLERTEIQTNDETYKAAFDALKDSEKAEVEKLKIELLSNNIFVHLPEKNKRQILNGQWRLNDHWVDLALKAGFNEAFFRQQYKFLCAYAHSSRLSVIQIQQAKNLEAQRELAKSSIGILMIVLAKNMYDYMCIMPQLNAIKDDYSIINQWKEVGERI